MNAIADDWLKRWESLASREARFAARLAPLSEALRRAGTTRHARAAERADAHKGARATRGRSRYWYRSYPSYRSYCDVVPAADLDAFKYLGFEDQFRGSREDIRERLRDYLPIFAGASDVLDVGCGRGELLDLLREHGINARGLDLNHDDGGRVP